MSAGSRPRGAPVERPGWRRAAEQTRRHTHSPRAGRSLGAVNAHHGSEAGSRGPNHGGRGGSGPSCRSPTRRGPESRGRVRPTGRTGQRPRGCVGGARMGAGHLAEGRRGPQKYGAAVRPTGRRGQRPRGCVRGAGMGQSPCRRTKRRAQGAAVQPTDRRPPGQNRGAAGALEVSSGRRARRGGFRRWYCDDRPWRSGPTDAERSAAASPPPGATPASGTGSCGR